MPEFDIEAEVAAFEKMFPLDVLETIRQAATKIKRVQRVATPEVQKKIDELLTDLMRIKEEMKKNPELWN